MDQGRCPVSGSGLFIVLAGAFLPRTILILHGARSGDLAFHFQDQLCQFFLEKNIPFADEYRALLKQHQDRVPMLVKDGRPPMFRTDTPPKTDFDRLQLRCSGMGSKFEIMPDGGCIPCAILPDAYVNIYDFKRTSSTAILSSSYA